MDLMRATLQELGKGLRESRIRAADLLESCARSRDETQGAYRVWDEEGARRMAGAADAALNCGADPGPLCGIPVSMKDIFGVTGFDTYAGSSRRLPEPWTRDGPLVSGIRNQIAAIVGKTHTVEFAFSGLGMNPHWGTPLNPHGRADERVPGGSSSGAAVSVCEGSSLLAVGTDTAGSIRVPAGMVGVAGLKTTKGLWSTQGIVPLSHSLDTPGLMARDAHDLAYAFAALEGMPTFGPDSLADVTIETPHQVVWEDCDAGIVEAIEAALGALVQKGAKRRDIDIPEAVDAVTLFQRGGLAAAELGHFIDSELPDWWGCLGDNVRARVESNYELKAREYIDRKLRLDELAWSVSDRIRDRGVIATPTVAITPPRREEVTDPEAHARTNMKALRNTVIGNFLGMCGITIPVGKDRIGMPVGLQLLGPPFAEVRLLRAAMAIERALEVVIEPEAGATGD